MPPDHFIFPNGELREAWFPHHDLSIEVLRPKLDAARERYPDRPDAREAWVYAELYEAVYLRKSDEPVSVTEDGEGRTQHTAEQAIRFLRKAEHWRERLDSLLPDTSHMPRAPRSSNARAHRV
jgi:cyclopropane fatty-acyl-phospholipid synthase-like methyltransferase